MNHTKTCTICAAPVQIQNIVNQMLAGKIKMVTIAAETGFSKSTVHRHSSKCLSRRALAAYKEKRFQTTGSRYVIRDEAGTLRDGNIKVANAREADFVLQIVYDKPVTVEGANNPSALLAVAHAQAVIEDALRFPKKPS